MMPMLGERIGAIRNNGGRFVDSKLRVVVIGGVAAGPKVASKVIRLCQEA